MLDGLPYIQSRHWLFVAQQSVAVLGGEKRERESSEVNLGWLTIYTDASLVVCCTSVGACWGGKKKEERIVGSKRWGWTDTVVSFLVFFFGVF